MSDEEIQKIIGDVEEDMDFLRYDTEAFDYSDFNEVNKIQIDEPNESNSGSLGHLQQKVIDKHEEFLLKLNQMVENEREHVDRVYQSYERPVKLNLHLKEELELKKEMINKAIEILNKMLAVIEQ